MDFTMAGGNYELRGKSSLISVMIPSYSPVQSV